jgi:hypothetical protein
LEAHLPHGLARSTKSIQSHFVHKKNKNEMNHYAKLGNFFFFCLAWRSDSFSFLFSFLFSFDSLMPHHLTARLLTQLTIKQNLHLISRSTHIIMAFATNDLKVSVRASVALKKDPARWMVLVERINRTLNKETVHCPSHWPASRWS